MEAAGLALSVAGTVGILGQIFDGCIKGYRVFSTASNLGKDSERMVCKIKIEEMRLWVWGREWGVVEGKFEAQLALNIWGHDGLKELATEILGQLLQTIMDCNKLQGRYGLREEMPGSVDREAYKKTAELKTSPSNRLKDDIKLRARWVIADKEKFERFLNDLEYFNDRLEKLFPSSRIATLQRTWTNELLQTVQRDTAKLDDLQAASVGKYPGLNTMASLKQLRINLDATEPSRKILSSSALKIPRWRLSLTPGEEGSHRARGTYQNPLQDMRGTAVSEDVPVIIDWIKYDTDMDLDARLQLYQRVDNLARMLHSCSARHPDLYTLDCVGYVDDTASNQYGIIHRCPATASTSAAPSFRSLSSLVDDPGKRTPDLNVRFQLSHKLAVALWSFHSLDWLHKSFSSMNILFFDEEVHPYSQQEQQPQQQPQQQQQNGRKDRSSEQHDLRSPYILGFDSSRPEGLVEMTYDGKFSNNEDIYRHPDSLGMWRQPYCKSFDVYSLGLLLLEIGLWKSVKVIHKPRYSPQNFKDKVLQALVPVLGSKTGSSYRNIVERCLHYDEKREGSKRTPHQMMEWVVLSLEALRV